MGGDGRRFRATEHHRLATGENVLASGHLAGTEPEDIYSGEQHRSDVGADEILDHRTPATGERRGCHQTDCRTYRRTVYTGVYPAEGVRWSRISSAPTSERCCSPE